MKTKLSSFIRQIKRRAKPYKLFLREAVLLLLREASRLIRKMLEKILRHL